MGNFIYFIFLFLMLGALGYGMTRKAQGRYSERNKDGIYKDMDIKSKDEIKSYRKQNSIVNKIKEKNNKG